MPKAKNAKEQKNIPARQKPALRKFLKFNQKKEFLND